MNSDFENGGENLTDATSAKLKDLSRAILRLHKILLDAAKIEYEAKNGAIAGVNQYLQLVLDDPHFAWLRKFSSLVALLDEAVWFRRAASEPEALAILDEARILLNFQDEDKDFNDKFQIGLQKNPDAVLNYNEALALVGNSKTQ